MQKTLDSILEDASDYVESEFKLNLEKSELKIYSPENWRLFCEANHFQEEASGLYVPDSYSAYVKSDNSFLVQNIFHELYGHGLFCEHSDIGKKYVSSDDKKSFLYNLLKEPRYGFFDRNVHNYEAFAVWIEGLLSQEIDSAEAWNAKKLVMPNYYHQLLEYMNSIEKELSREDLMMQMGFYQD